MSEPSKVRVNQTVELKDGRTATVQYVGRTEFAAGDWVGVVLEDATGKNDGSVQGRRYFDCQAGHGMFIRPETARVIDDEPTPKPKERPLARVNGAAGKSRPQSMVAGGLKRHSLADQGAAKRQSINAGSPTPGANGALRSRLGSPSKSPTKQLSITGSSDSTSRTTTPSNTPKPSIAGSKASRLSMAQPVLSTSKAQRPSIAGAMNGAAKTSSIVPAPGLRGSRMSIRPESRSRLGSVGGASQDSDISGRTSPGDSLDAAVLSPPSSELKEETHKPLSASLFNASGLSLAEGLDESTMLRGRSPLKPTPRVPTATIREIEDLKTKLRVLEKKRMEDRDKFKALDKVQAERDRFEGIIQKLQTKYQPLQQEVADLKKRIKEEEAKVQAIETMQAEHDIVVESATLDREMAEETAEALRTELDALRQKHEEIQLEIEILREENQELGKEMSPEEKTSQGWLQMERSNERLREALVKLRDITQQQEADLKSQVAELEKDLLELSGIREESLHTKESLAQSKSVIEELRLQLDTALGAEEMIEELTEKNMALSQQVEDLKAAVEDLESLKEINDELEITHIETEKQLHDEIDYSESVIADQKRKSATQAETIQDLEYTVNRFHDLVSTMQSDLEDMRASQQITESEANDLTNRSKAMMDLNMKLQLSASKAQTKAIDVELGKMEAYESAEHLAIVERFLPEAFGTQKNSVLAYMRFRRLRFRADLMHHVVKDKISGQLVEGHDDDVLARCDLLDKLIWVRGICEEFISYFQGCTPEAFTKLAVAFYDLEPIERAFIAWTEHLKKNDLNERQCAEELQRSIALMTHLAEVHITEGLEQRAQNILVRASMLQSHLEGAATAMSYIKILAQTKAVPASEDDEDEDENAHDFLRKADEMISQMRSAKVTTSKAIRNLEDLKTRSLTLDESTLPTIEQSQSTASELAASTQSMGISVSKLLNEEGRNTPLTYAEIISATSTADDNPLSLVSTKLISTMTQVRDFFNFTSSLTHTVETPSPPLPPPWQLLAQKLKEDAVALSFHESELLKLRDEMAEKNTTLALREQIVEEMSVKVEVLEKRVSESGGQREKVRELEIAAENARAKENELRVRLTGLQQDLRSLESERDMWKNSVPTAVADSNAAVVTQNKPSAEIIAQIQNLKSQISTLESTIRYLRRQYHAQHINSSLSFLSEPLIPSDSSSQALLQSEARDVFKEMVDLVTQSENQMVKLHVPKKEDRLKWRPVKETTGWQYNRVKEEWEGWKEWRDSVIRRGNGTAEKRRKRHDKDTKVNVLAQLQVNIPEMNGLMKGPPQQVRIVRPEEWEDIGGMVGVA